MEELKWSDGKPYEKSQKLCGDKVVAVDNHDPNESQQIALEEIDNLIKNTHYYSV